MEDFACRTSISPWSLAARLLLVHGQPRAKDFLAAAPDDIMLIRIELTPDSSKTKSDDVFVLNERISGNRLAEIDELQEFWKRSILFVLPTIEKNWLLDLLLCCREGMINALKYGCGGLQSESASLLLSLSPSSGRMRMVISDPGPGHDFDFETHVELANNELIPEHRGLGMMKAIAEELYFRRNNAEIELIFTLKSHELQPMVIQ